MVIYKLERSTEKKFCTAVSSSAQLSNVSSTPDRTLLLKGAIGLWRQDTNRAPDWGCLMLAQSSSSLLFGNRSLILTGVAICPAK